MAITSGPPRVSPPPLRTSCDGGGRRCSGGRGVCCEPLATLGCDWHTLNDTMLAYGRLLVDDPERIGPDQAIGMDQTLFNREYRTQQWATTFDSPPEIRRAA